MSEQKMIDRWNALRTRSEMMWEAAAEDPDPKRAARAQAAADESCAIWDEADDADQSDVAGLIDIMERARALAAEWGDDSPEREAIAMLREVQS